MFLRYKTTRLVSGMETPRKKGHLVVERDDSFDCALNRNSQQVSHVIAKEMSNYGPHSYQKQISPNKYVYKQL